MMRVVTVVFSMMLLAGAAMAQTPDPPAATPDAPPPATMQQIMVLARQMIANQIGVLEYCKVHGAGNDAAIAKWTGKLAATPTVPGADDDAATTAGRNGTLEVMQNHMDLSSLGDEKTKEVCQKMNDKVMTSP